MKNDKISILNLKGDYRLKFENGKMQFGWDGETAVDFFQNRNSIAIADLMSNAGFAMFESIVDNIAFPTKSSIESDKFFGNRIYAYS